MNKENLICLNVVLLNLQYLDDTVQDLDCMHHILFYKQYQFFHQVFLAVTNLK